MGKENRHIGPKIFRRLMAAYGGSDYVRAYQARFIFYFSLACTAVLLVTFLYSPLVQLIDPSQQTLNLPMLMVELSGLICFLGILVLLAKGHEIQAGHLLICAVLSVAWGVMFLDRGTAVGRLDSIVFVLAILSITPLMVRRRSSLILVYALVNIPILWLFMFSQRDSLGIDSSAFFDYMADVTVTLLFMTVTCSTVFTMNRKAMDRLKESEQNMASVLNNTKDAIVRIDKNFRHIFANQSLYTTTGLSPEQYLGKTNEEIGMPDELCTFWRKIHESVFRNRKPEIVEFTFITANKGEGVFQAVVTPEFDENKEVATIISVMRDITKIKKAESEKNAFIEKLEKALAEIKTLRGFIPICASCKNIRDDKGYWQQIEQYVQARSDAQFSHSLCPKCAKKLYPDIDIASN